jgi:uncharacterized protein (TIGR04222 family)
MNPFDLRGPEFLFFYFCFSLVVISAIAILRRRAESGPAPKIDMGDPYLIAYMRGGEHEALRVAVVSLVDRGMLVMDGELIRRADQVTSDITSMFRGDWRANPLVRRADQVTGDMVARPIERAVLEKFSLPGEAASILSDKDLKPVFQAYQNDLERAGLLPDSVTRVARLKRLLLGLMTLGIVGVIKIQIGLSLNKPIVFLVLMMIVAMAVAAATSFPRLTARGKAALKDITNLYSGLRMQIYSSSPGSASAELAMFAAVFGVGELAATPFGYAQTLFPRATSSSSDGCGSSDGGGCGGGGGGCGGGGCGGCGSS